MRATLSGPSAMAWWLTSSVPLDDLRQLDGSILGESTPRAPSLICIESSFPSLSKPVHLLAKYQRRDRGDRWKCHTTSFPFPYGSFLQIGSGLYASSPELSFIQSCHILSTHQALKAGSALCGTFQLDNSAPSGLRSRPPLTSVAKILATTERLKGLAGASRAHNLARHLAEYAASPPEAFLALALQCPTRLGGYGLPKPQLNARLIPSPRARKLSHRATLIPDLLWRRQKLIIEFDSDALHLTSSQIERDASKRLALNAEGYRVITLTSRQLSSKEKMRDIAHEVALHLGTKFRQRSAYFATQNSTLFAEGPSLNFLFNESETKIESHLKEKRSA